MLFFTVSSRQGTTVLIFMRSCQLSPQPGLHGDKPLSACLLLSAFASLTLEPLLSLCESLSPQSHPHQACDLIRTKPLGVCWTWGIVGGVARETDHRSFSSIFHRHWTRTSINTAASMIDRAGKKKIKKIIQFHLVYAMIDVHLCRVIQWFSGTRLCLS